MPARRISLSEAQRTIRAIEDALRAGYRPPGTTGQGLGAIGVAADRLGLPRETVQNRLRSIERAHGLAPDWSLWRNPESELPRPTNTTDAERRALAAEARAAALAAELEELKRDAGNPAAIASALGFARQHRLAPPDWLLRPHTGEDRPGVPVLLWSDWHIGETVDPAQVYGVNAFNARVADERVRRLVERTIHLAFERVANPRYDGAVLWLGGDMVSGWLHEELVATDWCSPPEAVVWCTSRLRWAIAQLRDRFGRLLVVCSPGNHGRITRKPMAKGSAKASYDHIIYAEIAAAFESDPAVTVHAAADGEALVQVASTRLLFMHGHELGVRGGDGIIGALGPIARGAMKVGRSQASVGRDFDVLVMGHFHQPIWQPESGVIVNGTLKGWDEFSRVSRFRYGPASQMLFFVHPSWGPVQPFEVFLQPVARRKPVRWAALAEPG